MSPVEQCKQMKNKLILGINWWVRLNLVLLACMLVARPLFFLEVYYRLGLEPKQLLAILSGSFFDVLLVGRLFAFGLIPFVLLHCFIPKITRGIYIGLTILYVVVSALLSEYYCNLTMPLDHVILVYSPEELKTTVFSSTTSISAAQVLWFVLYVGVAVALVFLGLKLKVKKERLSWTAVFAVIFIVLAFLPYNRWIRKESFYSTRSDFCLAVNQPSYSYIKITDYLKHEKGDDETAEYTLSSAQLSAYQATHPDFEYDRPGYPIYRKATDPDVLGPFFKQTSDGLPPNLVMIIVEGLGRHLTGVTTPEMSFTPFIDSLAAEGLFWPNCFSASERTFGVLPSVLASAPHGRYGFAHILPMPRHHSLLLDLKRNGYTTSFFYGGDSQFGHYEHFMAVNQVSDLVLPERIVDDSAQYRLLMDNHRWGLDDDQLVDVAISHKKEVPDTRPHADVYLTLSTHEPFYIDGVEQYEEQVKKMVEQTPNLGKRERENILHNLNIYGVYLYMDQNIRRLIEDYASRPEFANTIFVITGDHRMAFVPSGIALRAYNVPLVVYSPLLKRSKTMEAVVSHLDITPSFNAFLHAQYDYVIDDHCHWLGTSFDTISEFRNTRKLSFMRNNRDVLDYYSGDYFLNNSSLMAPGSDLTWSPVDDEQLLQKYQLELDNFEAVSRFVVQHDLLMP